MTIDLDGLRAWFPAAVAFGAAVLAGLLARRLLLRRLSALAARTSSRADDLLLAAARRHLPLWFALGGLALAARLAPLGEAPRDLLTRLAAVAFLVSLTLAAARFAGDWLARTADEAGASARRSSLTRQVGRAAILVAGALLVLANLGLEITPLLTALGVTSLAVALALQPTLSNLFAGIHLSVARPIRIGDYVELDDGTQGHVTDIGWRATQIVQLPNNLVVVPNSKLAEMVIKNYSLPDPPQAVLVPVGVAYGSDLEEVEEVTCAVAREVQREVPGAVRDFEPFIRYNGFGDSAIDFTVILRGCAATDRFAIMHEFVKRLKARYDREGIEIPFPQRVVHQAAPPLGSQETAAHRRGEPTRPEA